MRVKKQIQEDFNLAKQLTAFDVIDPPKPKVAEPVKKVEKYEGPCSSKMSDLLDSLTLQDETILTPTIEDDKTIAELLQAEFDLEYDEEIKRLEASRNKSMNFIILC